MAEKVKRGPFLAFLTICGPSSLASTICNWYINIKWSSSASPLIICPSAVHTVVLIFTSPQTLFGREVLFFSCESVSPFVCLFVRLWFCLWFCDQDNSKSSRPIFMKFGRTLPYYKIKVKFEFENNRISRLQTGSKRNLKKRHISKSVISIF